MLATGGSAIAAVTFLKQYGANNIKFMCIIAAPEGLNRLHEAHPDVEIFCAALDKQLNDHGYIMPAWAMRATGSTGRNKEDML